MSDIVFRLTNPLLRRLPRETAHRAAIRALALGLVPASTEPDDPVLGLELWGHHLPNPIGMAAGFDKEAEAIDGLLALGFALTEAGTVTPLPQPGNPRPRLFRLDEDAAIINRLGFNSGGVAAFAGRLARRKRRGGAARGLVGANVGVNKDSGDGIADCVIGIEAVAGLADYLVVNVSSPNTPGLRDLQAGDRFAELVARCQEALRRAAPPTVPPLLFKIAPDLTEAEGDDIARIALNAPVDGLIVSNTTVARPPELRSRWRDETGGLSGRPLMAPSTAFLAGMYRRTGGKILLIGCGGVASGADAYAKIRAGASLVQLYSALVFQGPGLVQRIKRELAALLRADGFASVADAVGVDSR